MGCIDTRDKARFIGSLPKDSMGSPSVCITSTKRASVRASLTSGILLSNANPAGSKPVRQKEKHLQLMVWESLIHHDHSECDSKDST